LDEAGDLDYPAFLELKELWNATEEVELKERLSAQTPNFSRVTLIFINLCFSFL